jgi:hypothetical protein
MPRAGFEPVNPATKRSQTYALNCAPTGIGIFLSYFLKNEDSVIILYLIAKNKTSPIIAPEFRLWFVQSKRLNTDSKVSKN